LRVPVPRPRGISGEFVIIVHSIARLTGPRSEHNSSGTARPVTASRAFLARHRVFCIALLAGLGLRVVTMLGFPPAIWFGGDSESYVYSALRLSPSTSRESGYGLMLLLLRPFHSFAVVTAVQHLMGLAIAVMLYALLRRYGLPGWGATLATLPVLLDAYQIQLEQEILADTAFAFLVTAALTILLWRRAGPSLRRAAAAGVLLGLSATLWPVGLPLLIVLVIYLIVRKAGWRAAGAAALAGALPLVLYLGWFDESHGALAFNDSDGVFLWSRTMTFANCAVIRPPADERALCPDLPVADRPAASMWIWEANSPLFRLPEPRFTPRENALARNFALRAIAAQPGGYLHAVASDFLLTFHWTRPPHPTALMMDRYQFSYATSDWASAARSGGDTLAAIQRDYTGGQLAHTRAVQPFAGFMIGYQRHLYFRGTMLAVVLLIGLGGIARSWRAGGYRRRADWGGPGLLPWATALAILVVPTATADFSPRYALPAVPLACAAAALAFARSRRRAQLVGLPSTPPQPGQAGQPAPWSQRTAAGSLRASGT
jgi:hypothetical protein